ncbi:MAG: multi-sensor hybrid histidine kinase, partial [Candidatus Saccharibacteria bacterium]|nr:multi-sensor hybrid histidine kinase [Candidatus Saccharibacteria bacterium]
RPRRRLAQLLLVASVLNILIGSGVIASLMHMRTRLERKAARIKMQNGELEVQAEELAAQNEEIRAQSEELAQQSEEIEAQSEELAGQNRELLHGNQVLAGREEVLQAIVDASRKDTGHTETLREVCRRTLTSIGAPGQALAVMEWEESGGAFRVLAQVFVEGHAPLPDRCRGAESLATMVMKEGRTAYVDDFQERPDLAMPFNPEAGCRSALMTPLNSEGKAIGVLAVCAAGPTHWTQEQFRLLEWAAAQCGLLLECARWQQALKERTLAVEAANQAKDDFLASLSHELRTPLTPVMAVAGLLENDVRLPDDVISDIRMIQRNIAVQSRLIDDLLDLTRIARGRIDLNLQRVCLVQLVKESAEVIFSTLTTAGLTLDLAVEVDRPLWIRADSARLQQVFWNILNNSIKFSPGQSVISVRLAPLADAPGQVEITITDQGPGIAEEDAERIFQPFEQAAAAGRMKKGGLGLGLSIARAITELHDATVKAWPPGDHGGGRFTGILPLDLQPMENGSHDQKSAPPVPSAATASERPLRILLAEDHEDTGRSLCRLLIRRGYHATHAKSCGDAVQRWTDDSFDFLISDFGLPDGTGIDLITALKKITPGVRAICMSGYGMESDIARTTEAGFRRHLIKPVGVEALEDAIRSIVTA